MSIPALAEFELPAFLRPQVNLLPRMDLLPTTPQQPNLDDQVLQGFFQQLKGGR